MEMVWLYNSRANSFQEQDRKKNYHPRSFKSQGTDDGILSTMLKFRGNHINHDT